MNADKSTIIIQTVPPNCTSWKISISSFLHDSFESLKMTSLSNKTDVKNTIRLTNSTVHNTGDSLKVGLDKWNEKQNKKYPTNPKQKFT